MTPDRFFALVMLLDTRDGATTAELASALGVSLRTVSRDLNWLREAGLAVSAHRGRLGGVSMLPGAGSTSGGSRLRSVIISRSWGWMNANAHS